MHKLQLLVPIKLLSSPIHTHLSLNRCQLSTIRCIVNSTTTHSLIPSMTLLIADQLKRSITTNIVLSKCHTVYILYRWLSNISAGHRPMGFFSTKSCRFVVIESNGSPVCSNVDGAGGIATARSPAKCDLCTSTDISVSTFAIDISVSIGGVRIECNWARSISRICWFEWWVRIGLFWHKFRLMFGHRL